MKSYIAVWEFYPSKNRKLELKAHFVGWLSIQIGVHIDFAMLNLQLFFPCFYIHIGLESKVHKVKYSSSLDKKYNG